MKFNNKALLIMSLCFTPLVLNSCGIDFESEKREDQIHHVFELAKASGYTGTYEEWLESIKGADGAPGKDGLSIIDIQKVAESETEVTYNFIFSDNSTKEIKIPLVKGDKGETGNGISKIEKTSTNGLVDTYTITYTNGETATFIVNNGADGQNGEQGIQGIPGKDGHTPVIGISSDGYWTVDGVSTNIKAQGPKGDKGDQGDNGLTPFIGEDGNWHIGDENTGVKATGDNGTNGLSAYEIYKRNYDYKGTEAEWIYDLVSGKLAEKLNNVEKIIDTKVRISRGQQLDLPQFVNVTFKDGTYAQKEVSRNTKTIDINKTGVRTVYGTIDGKNYLAKCELRVVDYLTSEKYIDGYVNNLLEGDSGVITLSGTDVLKTATVSGDGYFRFEDIAYGDYKLKLDAPGYYLTNTKEVVLNSVTKDPATVYGNIKHVNFYVDDIKESGYTFDWHKDDVDEQSVTESHINTVPDITFVENPNQISDLGYASVLAEHYNLALMNDKLIWSTEIINRFYELYSTLPNNVLMNKKSKWHLTDLDINNDIDIKLDGDVYDVNLSVAAIKNATPRVALIDGQKGSYFSKRLYHAIVRFITDNGKDSYACDEILRTNFLTSFYCPDYTKLTQGITDEGPENFQEFTSEEKLLILTMFEEMPVGMHKIKELKYLVRRKTGHTHPLYPTAAAVTWPTANEPYIEFMDSAFLTKLGYYNAKRLIIHEKTHMLWEYYFSPELKAEWQRIGGWYENPDDPDGWSTTKQTEFVSAYAHKHNPNEDMAESVASYVHDPDLLKARSINKYNFIRDCIMGGSQYILSIKEELTFEVYNINPDYVYPGSITDINVRVKGNPYEDKRVDFTMYLSGDEKVDASFVQFRISPINDERGTHTAQFVDVQLFAKFENGRWVLRGSTSISKYSKSGYWVTDQIVIIDSAMHERYESPSDFQMKIYIDNPLEDKVNPTYVENSLRLSVREGVDSKNNHCQYLDITGKFIEDNDLKYISIRIVPKRPDTSDFFDIRCQFDIKTGEFKGSLLIQDYYYSGEYEVTEINIRDIAGNVNSYDNANIYPNTPEDKDEQNIINITTPNPDNNAPILDENDISLKAVPTNVDAPNGETLVTLKLRIKDDIAGLDVSEIHFMDPQGNLHFYYLYPSRYSNTVTPDVDGYEYHTFYITLPKGSAPGIWGVYDISLVDKSGNIRVYDFTEIIHFDVIE